MRESDSLGPTDPLRGLREQGGERPGVSDRKPEQEKGRNLPADTLRKRRYIEPAQAWTEESSPHPAILPYQDTGTRSLFFPILGTFFALNLVLAFALQSLQAIEQVQHQPQPPTPAEEMFVPKIEQALQIIGTSTASEQETAQQLSDSMSAGIDLYGKGPMGTLRASPGTSNSR